MRTVVLIGGKGTQLRPITYTVPKAMVPLRNKPYIQYVVSSPSFREKRPVAGGFGTEPDIGRDKFDMRNPS